MKLPTSIQLTRYLRAFRYGDRIRPHRDWMIIVVVSTVLLLVCVLWSYLLFRHVSDGSNLGTTAPPAPLNTASLETVRAVFDARTAAQGHYITDYHFVDPSR